MVAVSVKRSIFKTLCKFEDNEWMSCGYVASITNRNQDQTQESGGNQA